VGGWDHLIYVTGVAVGVAVGVGVGGSIRLCGGSGKAGEGMIMNNAKTGNTNNRYDNLNL
jgi:hypothetical protein